MFFIGVIVLSVVISGLDNIWIRVLAVLLQTVATAAVSRLFEYVDTHQLGIGFWWNVLKRRNVSVRLSFSYLYRILVNGKYLMVKGNRIKHQYQPIGGVYKYYDEAKSFLRSINYSPDIRMGNGDETDDLRIQLKGKYLFKFYEWFITQKDREYDPTREFYEEIIEPGLLSEEFFRGIKYKKICTYNGGIAYSDFNGCDEWLYADIFEIDLTDEQKKAVLDTIERNPDKLRLVTKEEIERLRTDDSVTRNIGNNAQWLLGD